jgi:hypothetical protein
MSDLLFFDSETHRIGPASIAPQMVCGIFTVLNDAGDGYERACPDHPRIPQTQGPVETAMRDTHESRISGSMWFLCLALYEKYRFDESFERIMHARRCLLDLWDGEGLPPQVEGERLLAAVRDGLPRVRRDRSKEVFRDVPSSHSWTQGILDTFQSLRDYCPTTPFGKRRTSL